MGDIEQGFYTSNITNSQAPINKCKLMTIAITAFLVVSQILICTCWIYDLPFTNDSSNSRQTLSFQPPNPCPVSVKYSGHMYKKVTLWRYRYFQLCSNGMLMYFDQNPSSKHLVQKGTVNVNNITTKLTPTTFKVFHKNFMINLNPGFTFKTNTNAKTRVWKFACESESERQKWMIAINSIIHTENSEPAQQDPDDARYRRTEPPLPVRKVSNTHHIKPGVPFEIYGDTENAKIKCEITPLAFGSAWRLNKNIAFPIQLKIYGISRPCQWVDEYNWYPEMTGQTDITTVSVYFEQKKKGLNDIDFLSIDCKSSGKRIRVENVLNINGQKLHWDQWLAKWKDLLIEPDGMEYIANRNLIRDAEAEAKKKIGTREFKTTTYWGL
eukprot:224491_1